jgi:hypothetical protein
MTRRSLAVKPDEVQACENHRRGKLCGKTPCEVVPGGYYFCADCRAVLDGIVADSWQVDRRRRPRVQPERRL